jgi:hypothetical protein
MGSMGTLGLTLNFNPSNLFMKEQKDDRQATTKPKPQVNYLLVIGCVIAVQSAMMKAQGPATSALKIVSALAGAGCCIAGWVQESKKQQKK